MSSDSIADIVSVVTVMYTAALVFMVSVSIHLQKPYLKQGHYLIAIFGILDLYVSTMSTSLMAYMDNIAMSIIAALALSMFWLKGVYRLRMLIAVHVLVVGVAVPVQLGDLPLILTALTHQPRCAGNSSDVDSLRVDRRVQEARKNVSLGGDYYASVR